jgi:ribosomal protein S18 acetylase RimI-like enzyme
MLNVTIRKAKKKDIPIILGLLYELERPKPKDSAQEEIFEKKLKSYLRDSDKELFIAEKGTEIMGFASIIFLDRLNQEYQEMYIPELIVTKKHQYKDVGTILVKSCIEIAKKKRCHRIRLESGNHRKNSHRFYKKIGFEQTALFFAKKL